MNTFHFRSYVNKNFFDKTNNFNVRFLDFLGTLDSYYLALESGDKNGN